MKKLLLPILLVFASSALARGAEVCPVLPPNSGLTWTYREGPDFDVCYATKTGTEGSAFGVYLGNWPSFKVKDAVRVGEGKVGDIKIIWYRNGDKDPTLAQQTLVPLNEQTGYIAHIWVDAPTAEELRVRQQVISRMSFKK